MGIKPKQYADVESAMLGTALYSSMIVLVPDGPPSDKGGKIDWMGVYLGVGGLILFNFVWKYVCSLLNQLDCNN